MPRTLAPLVFVLGGLVGDLAAQQPSVFVGAGVAIPVDSDLTEFYGLGPGVTVALAIPMYRALRFGRAWSIPSSG